MHHDSPGKWPTAIGSQSEARPHTCLGPPLEWNQKQLSMHSKHISQMDTEIGNYDETLLLVYFTLKSHYLWSHKHVWIGSAYRLCGSMLHLLAWCLPAHPKLPCHWTWCGQTHFQKAKSDSCPSCRRQDPAYPPIQPRPWWAGIIGVIFSYNTVTTPFLESGKHKKATWTQRHPVL